MPATVHCTQADSKALIHGDRTKAAKSKRRVSSNKKESFTETACFRLEFLPLRKKAKRRARLLLESQRSPEA